MKNSNLKVKSIEDLKIGKRYSFCPFYDGDKIKNGLLEAINNNIAYLRTKDGLCWEIPITKVVNGIEYFDDAILEKYK